jgi:hypothetical protein
MSRTGSCLRVPRSVAKSAHADSAGGTAPCDDAEDWQPSDRTATTRRLASCGPRSFDGSPSSLGRNRMPSSLAFPMLRTADNAPLP